MEESTKSVNYSNEYLFLCAVVTMVLTSILVTEEGLSVPLTMPTVPLNNPRRIAHPYEEE
jgi:hypothetical protein